MVGMGGVIESAAANFASELLSHPLADAAKRRRLSTAYRTAAFETIEQCRSNGYSERSEVWRALTTLLGTEQKARQLATWYSQRAINSEEFRDMTGNEPIVGKFLEHFISLLNALKQDLLPLDLQVLANLLDSRNDLRNEKFKQELIEDFVKKLEEINFTRQAEPELLDCIILCGGYSQRLWPLTTDFSKHLLPVGGKPILGHVLDFARRSSLDMRIQLLTNPKFAEQIQGFVSDSYTPQNRANIDVLVEPDSSPQGKLGPVGALDFAMSGSHPRDTLVLAGDNVFGFQLDEFIAFARSTEKSSNAVYRFPSREDTSEYGVVKLDENCSILDLQEKQEITNYREISTACYYLRSHHTKLIPEYLLNGGNPDSLGSFVHWLIGREPGIGAFVFESYWYDVGTRDKFLESNWKFLIDSMRGQTDEKSTVNGPVQIEPGAAISGSTIGPNVYVGTNAQITNCVIHDSVIMHDSVLRNSSVISSIVGPASKFEGSLYESVCGPGLSH